MADGADIQSAGRQVLAELVKAQPLMQSWRRDFHSHPELGFEEHRTAAFIADTLESLGIEVHRGVGGTGVVGRLKAGTSNRSVGLRADMDALPLQEANTFEHCSREPGKMHACGHDGHAASLLGAARYLAATRNFDGVVNFIFQPAEELLIGGTAMIDDGLFERFPCDSVFALHNGPSLAAGKYGIWPGVYMSGGAFFDIYVRGRGSHAAQPERGVDPIVIACHLTTALQTIVSRNVRPTDAAVVSITRIQGGHAYNVVPAEVVLSGTVRAFQKDVLATAEANLQRLASQIAAGFGGEAEVQFRQRFVPLVNDEEQTRFVMGVMSELADPEDVVRLEHPTMGSEDFAFMLEKVPGAYVLVGNVDEEHSFSVHHPSYDFNDAILPKAAALYARIAERKLSATA